VWLSPFYPSVLADGGYDVADYRDVDPRLGTLDDFDSMLAALHERRIKVVIDIVPNHSSDLHEWFQEALAAGRGSAARDRYIFREGTGPDGEEPPTDWVSEFGGSAWERVAGGQWCFHNYAKEQPDLKWGSLGVRADFSGRFGSGPTVKSTASASTSPTCLPKTSPSLYRLFVPAVGR
jgi:alpha-glucosidase